MPKDRRDTIEPDSYGEQAKSYCVRIFSIFYGDDAERRGQIEQSISEIYAAGGEEALELARTLLPLCSNYGQVKTFFSALVQFIKKSGGQNLSDLRRFSHPGLGAILSLSGKVSWSDESFAIFMSLLLERGAAVACEFLTLMTNYPLLSSDILLAENCVVLLKRSGFRVASSYLKVCVQGKYSPERVDEFAANLIEAIDSGRAGTAITVLAALLR